jgi:hypothetical protein
MRVHTLRMETILRVSAKEAPRWDRTLELASERDEHVCTYPGCGAGPGELCRNPITGRASRVPHVLHRGPRSEPPALGS